MPQADGTILIDTEINADGMKAGSKEVEAAVRRMAASVNDLGTKAKTALNKQVDSFAKLNQEYAAQAQKVEELKRKVAEYGNQKVPTDEYNEIQAQIDQARAKMDRLTASQEKFLAMGGSKKSNTYKRYQYDIEELANTVRYAEGELRDLEETGKAFTFGSDTKEAAADMERLASAERKLADMNNRLGTSYSSIKGQVNDYNNALTKTNAQQQKASASGNKLSKSLSNTGKSAKSASFGIGRMLGTSILFSAVFQAISGVMNAMKEGFTNLAQYSGTTNNSISMLWSSLERLKNSLATAFAPILNVVAPILSKFIDMLSTAASYVSMFFAFLSGKNTYTRAVAVQKDYAASLQDTASGAKDAAAATDEAAKAAEKYLSPLDDINRMNEKDKSSGGGSGSGGGGLDGTGTGPMFEEAEITDIPILEKIKNILSGLFAPFKKAWEAEGKNTVDAAKYAFAEILGLLESIGASFMTVWTNGTGQQTIEAILRIFQNILITIGNIAAKLNEAWNTNNLGTQIIQNIFNLFNSVLGTIERISGATAVWASTLDFTPLLSSINGLLIALQPLTDNIGAGLEWFWNNVLLPIAGWTIQEAVPTFLNMLSSGISVLNSIIEALKPLGIWLWESFLQPLGQWAGDVIISAMEIFTGLLQRFSDWISNNQELVQGFTVVIASFFAAWKITQVVSGIAGFIKNIGGVVGAVTKLGGLISTVLNPWTLALAGIITVGVLVYKNWDTIKAKAIEIWGAIQDWFETTIGNIKEFFKGLWTGIQETFQNIGSWFKEKFDAARSNVESAFKTVGKWFGDRYTDVTNAFKNTGTWFKDKFEDAYDFATGAFDEAGTFFGGVWDGIKSAFGSITGWFKDKFSDAWKAVKNVFSSGGEVFSGIKDGILESLKGVINGLITGINNVVAIPFNGLNSALDSLRNLSILGVTPFTWLPTISVPQIPYLASGAVIPPNKEFMAVLGDQNHGNNIEAPESLIRRIVREETGGNVGLQRIEVPVYLDRKRIAYAAVDGAKLIRMQTGKNPLELA